MTVYTVGHSTRTIEEFMALLVEQNIASVADVRAFPTSKRHPHFNRENLEASLNAGRITYRHMPALGGRRSASPGHRSRNGLWRVDAFRNYADYAETPDFARALDELEALARGRTTVFMCAEAVWWQCHRRLIADYMLARGWRVVHILAPGKIAEAERTPGSIVHDHGTLSYPPVQPGLLD